MSGELAYHEDGETGGLCAGDLVIRVIRCGRSSTLV